MGLRALPSVLVATAVTFTLLQAPAQAAPQDVIETISKAESKVAAAAAFSDDSSAAPTANGSGVSSNGLDVAFDGAGRAIVSGELTVGRGGDVTYAADDLGNGRKWWGYVVRLNRTESYAAIGTMASCTALFSKSPHWTGKALTIACGVMTGWSGSQIAAGKCLRINVLWSTSVQPWWGKC